VRKTIPLDQFDLPSFIAAIVTLCDGPELALPVVDEGFAIYDPTTTPMQKLESGQTVFARFTSGEGERFNLADGTQLELPDDFDGEGYFDDSSCYGFVVRLADGHLTFRSAVMRSINDETIVHEVDDAGPFEAAMIQFINSMRRNQD
jgi:hypothetical protein